MVARVAERSLRFARLNWGLDIVGTGSSESDLKKLAYELGIRDKVIFHGAVDDEALNGIYNAASLFVMPAVQGYGLPALEALSYRLPVILHADSGVSEVLAGCLWVVRVQNLEEEFSMALETISARIAAGEFRRAKTPELRTEEQWCQDVWGAALR
jgi:glycosyltransferase involved in cell wall biosynthesis